MYSCHSAWTCYVSVCQAHASSAAAKAAAERAEERASAWRSESQLLRDRLQQLERVRLVCAWVAPVLSPNVRIHLVGFYPLARSATEGSRQSCATGCCLSVEQGQYHFCMPQARSQQLSDVEARLGAAERRSGEATAVAMARVEELTAKLAATQAAAAAAPLAAEARLRELESQLATVQVGDADNATHAPCWWFGLGRRLPYNSPTAL